MLNIAIICEYNPFHKGHLKQIAYLKNKYPGCTVTALMSGSFVQRGEPAVFDKYLRAECAVRCGADLVLEYPLPHSMSGAQYFASGAVGILNSLGCFDMLCFGSESGDMGYLNRTAENQTSEQFENALDAAVKSGKNGDISYIRMREQVYRSLFGRDELKPNDILAVEYLKALKNSGSSIVPVTIKRTGSESASLSRTFILRGDYGGLSEAVPSGLSEIYHNADKFYLHCAQRHILAVLRSLDPEMIIEKNTAEINPGLAYRMVSSAKKSCSFDEFIENTGTKTYTRAKLRRTALNCIFGITEDMLKLSPGYTCLLASGRAGLELLHGIKHTSDIPVITKAADACADIRSMSLNRTAEDILSVMCENIKPSGFLIKKSPFIL